MDVVDGDEEGGVNGVAAVRVADVRPRNPFGWLDPFTGGASSAQSGPAAAALVVARFDRAATRDPHLNAQTPGQDQVCLRFQNSHPLRDR